MYTSTSMSCGRRLLVPLSLCLYLICQSPVQADDAAGAGTDVQRLSPLTVTASPLPDGDGRQVLPAETIQRLPTRGGSLEESLATVPRVQFSDNARLSTQGGEIRPPGVSISGGRVFDNQMLIDGHSTANLVDPAGAGPGSVDNLPAGADGLFLQNRLLESLTVYTSNVPARYGGFTGGVIDARIRKPSGIFGGKVFGRTTSDNWTQLRLDDEDEEDFSNSGSFDRQPRFDRYDFGAEMDVPLSDDAGLLVAAGRRLSLIQLQPFGEERGQRRQLDNLLLKVGGEVDAGTGLYLTLIHTPYKADYFQEQFRNSDFIVRGGGSAAILALERDQGDGKLELKLSGRLSENSRRSTTNEFITWRNTASVNWGTFYGLPTSSEGSHGDLDTEQTSLGFSADYQFVPLTTAGIEHRVGMGLAVNHDRGVFHRREDRIVYSASPSSATAATVCNGDPYCVDGEQYLNSKFIYPADRASANILQVAPYIEDNLRWRRLTLRPGLRLSYDDYMENYNPEPRLAAAYDLFGTGDTVLFGGLNRYYGRTLLTYKLREALAARQQASRTLGAGGVVNPWPEPTPSTSVTAYRYSKLDTPYSNERTLGIDQLLLGGRLTLSGLWRENHDLFARESFEEIEDGVTSTVNVLNNNGSSSYRSASLGWKREWVNQSLALGVTWQENESSNGTYDDKLNDVDIDREILYQGDVILKTELPAADFNRAWVGNLTYTVDLPYSLKFTNVTSYRSGYWRIFDTRVNDEEGRDIWEREKLHPSTQFDWKLSWQRRQLTLLLEVYNLFNHKVLAGGLATDNYELGRQFWVGAEYAF